MVFGLGGDKDKGKNKISLPNGEGEERSPLLGESSTRPPVRHGRGLLDDDGDSIDSREGRRGGTGADEVDSDAEEDALLSRSSSNTANGGRRTRRLRRFFTRRSRSSWREAACYFVLVLIGLLFLAFAILHVWIGRFVHEQFANDAAAIKERAPGALLQKGPQRIQLLHVGKDEVTVQIDMKLGVDARMMFGWNATDSQAAQQEYKKLSFVRKAERNIMGWAVRRVGQASFDLPEPVLLAPSAHPTKYMAQFALKGPVTVPLSFPKIRNYDPEDESWLRSVRLEVPVEVLQPAVLARFINHTLESKEADVQAVVQKAHLVLGREEDRTWLTRQVRKYGAQSISNITTQVKTEVPDSPDVPSDPAALVDLRSYNLVALPHNETRHHHNKTYNETLETLAVYATALITNPGYEQLNKLGLDLDIPFNWPYRIFLPVEKPEPKHGKKHKNETQEPEDELVLLARGQVLPFSIPSSNRKFDVSINGTVENSSNSSSPLAQSLSAFVSRYLAGKNNTVTLTFDSDSPAADALPSFLLPFLEAQKVDYSLPGLPPEEQDLLRDLTFDHLRVHPSEGGQGGWQCDGELQGELVMPEALDSLQGGINVTRIMQDIMLYDGTPPSGVEKEMPPVPLPLNAFARFRTDEWTPAHTFVEYDEKTGRNKTLLRATVKNAPLDIVRRDVLQRWLAKIIFQGSARTGIKGLAESQAMIRGFGDVQLHKLPVWGTFNAAKPTLMDLGAEVKEWLQ